MSGIPVPSPTREAQHVVGHALAPLPTGVRTGECLAQARCRGRQLLGGVGVMLQRAVDLTEALCRGLAQLLHQRTEPADVGRHRALHLIEAGSGRRRRQRRPGQWHRRNGPTAGEQPGDEGRSGDE